MNITNTTKAASFRKSVFTRGEKMYREDSCKGVAMLPIDAG